MEPSRHTETERKYDAQPTTIMPTLSDLEGVASMSQAVELSLEAVYFDTDGLDLARRRVTLRRRRGGDDSGWHLKLPEGTDSRVEVRLPLGTGEATVPPELLDPVRALVRDRPLGPVAEVTTRRRQHDLVGEGATVLAQVCDDEVSARPLVGGGGRQAWREWEVELLEGPVELLDTVEERLLAAGARRSALGSKLARTLGDVVSSPTEDDALAAVPSTSTAGVLLAYLAEHRAELHRHDAGVRTGAQDAVHQLRIAARRLRSALTTYRPVLAAGSTDALREELRWLGRALSAARDAEVLRERLMAVIAAEPVELVIGPVATHLGDELQALRRRGRDEAVDALRSGRYFRLLDSLDAFLQSPPLAARAGRPAATVVPKLLERDARRLRRAVKAVADADGDHETRDLALHEARKKAKRMRYAAESAQPVFPTRAEALRTVAKDVQSSLGEHQDTVLARQRLRDLGIQAHLNGQNAFSYGRLHALEQCRADEARRAFRRSWKRFPGKDLRRWLKS